MEQTSKINDYAYDCVHLHACRRLCKRNGIKSRGCNMNCTAYQPENVSSWRYEQKLVWDTIYCGYVCMSCGYKSGEENTLYCPNCGAKMKNGRANDGL